MSTDSTNRSSAATVSELRNKCASRVAGLGMLVKRLRDTGNPDDLADAAFLLGALDDISDYVDYLRELADV